MLDLYKAVVTAFFASFSNKNKMMLKVKSMKKLKYTPVTELIESKITVKM